MHKRVMFQSAVFFSLFVLVATVNLQATGFVDDHNDGSLSGWTISGGRGWSESGGAVSPAAASVDEGFLINDYNTTNNGVFEVEMTASQWNGQEGGVVFRWNSTSSYYYVSVLPANSSSSRLYFCINTLDELQGTEVGQNFVIGATFTLKIEISDNNFTFYLDNTLIGSVTDFSHTSGSVGYAYSNAYMNYTSYNSSQWTDVASNLAPTDMALSSQNIKESLDSGTVIGVFSTIDPDGNDNHTYQLVSGIGDDDNSRFVIVQDTLKSMEPFDYLSDGSLQIRVRTTDDGIGGLYYEDFFTIIIVEVENYAQWSLSQNITFNTTDSGVHINSSIRKFPLLIRLDSVNFDFSRAQADGDDLRFSDPDGTPLDYEIEYWKADSQDAAIWVLVPVIDANSDQDYIVLYAGNSSVNSKENSEEVFNTSNGFEAVWHMNEEVSGINNAGVYQDASINNNHGEDRISSSLLVDFIGKGHDFDGLTDYINVATIDNANRDSLSLSMWVRPDNQSSFADIISKEDGDYANSGFGIKKSDDDRFVFSWCRGGRQDLLATSYITDNGNTWYYVTATFTTSTQKLFINGVLDAETNILGSITGSSNNLNIGRRSSRVDREYDGIIEEVRISTIERDENWIKLSYENQRLNSIFLSFEISHSLPVVTVSSLVTSVSEEGNSTEAFEIIATVAVASDSPQYIQAKYTVSGTALEGTDYYISNSPVTVTISKDSLSGRVRISVVPIDDSDDEGGERISFLLLVDSLYTVGLPDSAYVMLEDGDAVYPPSIVQSPLSKNLYEGDIATFNVVATGTRPFTYEWRINNNIITGATDSVYTIPPVSLASDSALIFCIVSNTSGIDTSNVATVYVSNRPDEPRVISHPVPVSTFVGDTVAFFISAGGDAPLTYQWYSDSGAIIGASDTILRFGPVSLFENGKYYYCVVSNNVGSKTSRSALLSVNKPSSQVIVVSGELFDFSGVPVGYSQSVAMDITVNLYPKIDSDTSVYTETFLLENKQAIEVFKGKFVVRLGQGTSNNDLVEQVRIYPNLYVSFTVNNPGGDPEVLNPRTILTASPYALSAVPGIIKGQIDPGTAGIEAAIGTHFVNTLTNITYIRTHNTWVVLE